MKKIRNKLERTVLVFMLAAVFLTGKVNAADSIRTEQPVSLTVAAGAAGEELEGVNCRPIC